jgi:hypothetical protein
MLPFIYRLKLYALFINGDNETRSSVILLLPLWTMILLQGVVVAGFTTTRAINTYHH